MENEQIEEIEVINLDETNNVDIEHTKEQLKDLIVFDLETTGLCNQDCITEIGAVKVRDYKIVDSFQVFVKIPENSYKTPLVSITPHITEKVLEEEGICIDEALERFFKFIEDDKYIFAQNAKFDLGHIENNNYKFNDDQKIYDTIEVFKQAFKSKSYSLSKISEHLPEYAKVYDPNSHHAADYDSEVTFIALKNALDLIESDIITLSVVFGNIQGRLEPTEKQLNLLRNIEISNLKSLIKKANLKDVPLETFDQKEIGRIITELYNNDSPSDKQMYYLRRNEARVKEIMNTLKINKEVEDVSKKEAGTILGKLFAK